MTEPTRMTQRQTFLGLTAAFLVAMAFSLVIFGVTYYTGILTH